MLELNKWNDTEEESISDADRLAFLEEFTDADTLALAKSRILAEKKWAAQVRSELKREDLTRAERLYYRKQLAKMSLDKEREEDLIEAKQKLAEAEQKTTEVQQKLVEVEQKLINFVMSLLQESLLTEEEIARLANIDIKQVEDIKEQLN